MDVIQHWYLVHTKPRKEWIAKEHLQRQGYDLHLPLIQHLRRQRGRWLNVVEPLFPRYIFVRLTLEHDDFRSIRYTTGVHTLVSFSEAPAIVPDRVVDSLKRAADPNTGLHTLKLPVFAPGNALVIDSGPLAGMQGIFLAETAEERVTILLNILGRENRITLQRDLVRLA